MWNVVMKFLIVLIGISVFIMMLIYFHRMERKKLFARFNDRNSLSDQKFYDDYYRDSAFSREVVEELRVHVANTLSLPLEKIIPTDRFDKELVSYIDGDFDGGVEILSYEMGRLAQRNGVAVEPGQIRTLDDYIRFVAPIWNQAPP